MRGRWLWGLAAWVAVAGCSDGGGTPEDAGGDGPGEAAVDAGDAGGDAGPPAPLDYSDDAHWLCRPGMEDDQCYAHDLTATAILPDGSTEVVEHVPADDPGYDCFYVYPTVDLTLVPGNNDLSDTEPILDPLLNQAAPFTRVCRVFAPLYRQVTIGTYTSDQPTDQYFDLAYGDVEAAFERYLDEWAGDRPFVIMGHSQGAHMTARLLQEVVEPDDALRSRLIAGLQIGGDVGVPEGELVGGSFEQLPLCTSEDETGCIIAYRSYAEGYPPEGEGLPAAEGFAPACNNPAALGGGEGTFAGTYLPMFAFQATVGVPWEYDVDTPFVLLPDLYAGECVESDAGDPYLEIRVRPGTDDVRENRIPFDGALFSPSALGLHLLDYNFALDDLIRLVDTKAAAL